MSLVAVLTGDIVNSSQLSPEERKGLLALLHEIFPQIKETEEAVEQDFDVFRGDSFQGMLNDPQPALRLAIYVRLKLLADNEKTHPNDWDARIAIGIGGVSYQSEEVSTSDGPAFRNSGPILDEMKGGERIKVTSPWPEFNWEMKVATALLDGVSSRWTSKQATVMLLAMEGKKQGEIASKLEISQPAVSKMLRVAHWEAIEELLGRYEHLIKKHKST